MGERSPENVLFWHKKTLIVNSKNRIKNIIKYFNDYNVVRPDLLDWRQVEKRDVRERIDLAFHIMDREYGVTRLLDPEGENAPAYN